MKMLEVKNAGGAISLGTGNDYGFVNSFNSISIYLEVITFIAAKFKPSNEGGKIYVTFTLNAGRKNIEKKAIHSHLFAIRGDRGGAFLYFTGEPDMYGGMPLQNIKSLHFNNTANKGGFIVFSGIDLEETKNFKEITAKVTID